MGWWPSIFGGGQTDDPLNKLDPKLREFLEKESPIKYSQSSDKPQQNSPPPPPPTETSQSPDEKQQPQQKSGVPTESLYQDGRYAHLWKNYRPQAQIEAEVATDHERLMGVLQGYNERKSSITRVAMENCADQQEAWINCMKHGEWKDQLQMCRHQVRKFEQCYTMQSRFLRALGYGSVPGRPIEVEEDIQLHADALYQRVLQHEAAVEQAKKDGTPIPKFDPAIPKVTSTNTAAGTTTTTTTAGVQPSEEVQQKWREHLEKLPEEERVVEEVALRADLQAKSDVARNMREILDKKKENPDGTVEVGVGEAVMKWLKGGK